MQWHYVKFLFFFGYCKVLLFAKYKKFYYFVETKECESYYIELYIQHMSFTVPDMPLVLFLILR